MTEEISGNIGPKVPGRKVGPSKTMVSGPTELKG